MKRLLCVLLLVGASAAMARGDSRAEAQRVVEQLVSGAAGLNQAVNRLTFLGERAWAANELARLLRREPEARRRARLLEALAALAVPGDDDVEDALLAAARSDDLSLRLTGLRGLAQVGGERGMTALQAGLLAPQPVVRREAARALGALRARRAAAALGTAAAKEEDLETRVVMLVAIGRAGDPRQAPALEARLKDPSEATRLAAAQGLCLLGAPRGLAFARTLLSSSERGARLQGVLLLEGVTARVAGPVLTPALQDPEARVRAAAGRVLVEGGDKARLGWMVREADRASADDRLVWEDQLEKLRLSDEERQALRRRAEGG